MGKILKQDYYNDLRIWLEHNSQVLDRTREDVCKPFENDTAEARVQRIARAQVDKLYFVQTYFPHYATLGQSEMHRAMMEQAGQPGINLFVVFRGGAKSTLITILDTVHAIVFERSRYTLIGSLTVKQAARFVYAVRRELERNHRIINDFGKMTSSGVWNVDAFETSNGCRVEVISYGTEVRGSLWGATRPNMIKLDDITTREIERNPERIRDVIEWITSDVEPSLAKGGTLDICGTPIESNGVIQRLVNDPEKQAEWHLLRYPAIVENAKGQKVSAWPERYTLDELEKKKKSIGTYSFSAEYMLEPIKGNKFRQEWFRYMPMSDFPKDGILKACWCDPALGKTDGCDVAIITIAKEIQSSKVYLLSAYIDKYSPEQAREIFEQEYLAHQPIRMGGEENGMQSIYTGALHGRMTMDYVGYPTTGNKRVRIESLSSMFERGDIIFPEELTAGIKKLIEQLIYYPRINMDGPDALERAIWVLNQQTNDVLRLAPV